MVSCLGYLFVICLFSVIGWMDFSSRPLFLSCFFFGRSLGSPTDIHFDRCLANPACQRASQIFHTPVSDVPPPLHCHWLGSSAPYPSEQSLLFTLCPFAFPCQPLTTFFSHQGWLHLSLLKILQLQFLIQKMLPRF